MAKVVEGVLYLNGCDRLALNDWVEFHCGSAIKLCLCGVWVETRIEMNGRGEWYAVGLPGLRLVGLKARGEM